MMNSFFQTHVVKEDIKKTAVRTPWGLYKWVVMPMGLCNSPASHQCHVNNALAALIGDSCYVYLDNIIFFFQTTKEHAINRQQVLQALKNAKLYCSPKKTVLAATSAEFLGPYISRA